MPCATLREMLEAGVHFGHQTRYWNPSMAPYIFGERNKIHIINLEITQRMLDEAAEQVRQWAAEGKTILIVGTKRAAQDIVKAKAEECGMPYVSQRWLGGTLTNFHTVRNSLKRLQDLKRMEGENLMARISKKEALRLTREKLKLERSLGGIEEMERIPDALFVIDVRYENIAVREARRLDIPVVAIVDSNSSVEGIDRIIPGNDDAIRSIQLYMDVISDAIEAGRKQAEEEGVAVEAPAPRETSVKRKGRRAKLRVESKAEPKAVDATGETEPEAEAAPAEDSAEPVEAAAPAEAAEDSAEPVEAEAQAEAAEDSAKPAEAEAPAKAAEDLAEPVEAEAQAEPAEAEPQAEAAGEPADEAEPEPVAEDAK